MTIGGICRLLLAVVGVATVGTDSSAGELPPIRRLRVPAEDVVRYFGAETAIRSLDIDELERRLEAARTALDVAPPAPARLLRAEHRARWMEGGLLEGQSTLTVDVGTDAPAAVVLDPWGLPLAPEPMTADLRTRPDGRLIAWVTRPGVSELVVSWRMPVPITETTAELSLDLPECPLSALILDLPEGMVVDVSAPARSRRIEAEPGRSLLRVDGIAGRSAVSLRHGEVEPRDRDEPWLKASHRFEIAADGSRFEAEWLLRLPSPPPQVLETSWDHGLEATAVTGAGVDGFEVLPGPGSSSLVRIRLADGAAPEQRLRLEGTVRVPSHGPWTIPRIRLDRSLLVEERALVRIGPEWAVVGVRPLASQPIEPPAEVRSGAGRWLAFDATGDGPLAVLELAEPGQPPRVDLRASLRVETDRATLDAEGAWKFRDARPSTLSVELPTEWTCEDVQIVSLDEPTLWSTHLVPGVGQVITITPPQAREADAPVVVRLRASRPLLATTRMTVPRLMLRPGRLGDELWSLTADERITVRPLSPGGIEWLDPLVARADGGDEPPRLAWRWLDERANLDLDLARVTAPPHAVERMIARPADDSIELDAYLSLDIDDPGLERLEMIEPAGAAWSWSLVGDGADRPLRELGVRELPRADENAPRRLARVLVLPRRALGSERIVLHARGRLVPSGGRLPRFELPEDWSHERILLVAAAEDRGLELSGADLVRLDPAPEFAAAMAAIPDLDAATLNARTNRLAYRLPAGGPEPELRVAPRQRVSAAGFVAHAESTRRSTPDGRLACRLRAEVVVNDLRALQINLPSGATLQAAWIDGAPFAPIQAEDGLAIPQGSARGRTDHVLVLDYLLPAGSSPSARETRFNLPALATTWILEGSERAERPGLRDVMTLPPAVRPGWPSASVLPPATTPPAGGALGAWLQAESRGSTPWIVDAEALAASGLGPGTRFQNTADSAAEALAALGLVARPAGFAYVLTTSVAPADPHRTARVAEAARDGRDRSGRYVTPWVWAVEPNSDQRGRRFLVSSTLEATAGERRRPGQTPGAWLAAAALIAIGWPGSRRPHRSVGPLAGAIGLLGGLALLRPDLDPWITPLALAAGFLAAWRLIASGGRQLPEAVSFSASTLLARGGGLALLAASLHALAAPAAATSAQENGASTSPILVLLPYERAEDAGAPARRAIIRLEDLDRLEERARMARERAAREQSVRADGFGARSARHVVRELGDRLVLESTITLVGADDTGRDWPIALDGWLGVSVWLDGVEATPALEPGGRRGQVRVRGPGEHVLRIQATRANATPGPIPIPSAARATLVRPGDLTGAVDETIGPRDRLPAPTAPDPPASRASVELLTRWEPGPLGDLLEIQLRNAGTEPLSSAVIQLPSTGSRLLPNRSGKRRDRVRLEPDGERSRFQASFVPPLEAGEAATLSAWSPAGVERPLLRNLPRATLSSGADLLSSRIALRPRDGWSVFPVDPLGPSPSRLPVGEFVAAWVDPIPSEQRPTVAWDALDPRPLTLAVRPATPRTRLRPRVECVVDGARVRVRAEVEIVEAPASLGSLAVRLPRGFRLFDVVGEGVTGWHRATTADRIVIAWSPAVRYPSSLTLLGWLETDGSGGPIEGLSRELSLTIPEWQAELVEPTDLTLAAAPEVALDIEESTGWSRSVPTKDAAGPLPVRAAFRVDEHAAGVRLRYRLEGRPADVQVLSHLEFQPDAIEWRARARYRVRGGPCRELRLEVPTAFASGLEVRVEPAGAQVRLTPAGEATRVEVRFDAPTWEDPRVFIRSVGARRSGAVDFPTLVPLGLGRVDTYLAWYDASGRGLTAEGSAGVREVERARFTPRELDLEERPERRVYHVLRSGWSLRLRPSREPGDRPEEKIVRAEIEARVGLDGASSGRLLCVLEATPTHALAIRLPDRVTIVGAHDGTRFLPCYRSSSGRLIVPPGSGPVLAVYWSTPPRSGAIGLEFPVPEREGVPFQVLLRDETSSRPVRVESGPLVPVERPTLLVEAIELEARSIEAGLATLDRSDPDALRSLGRAVAELERWRGELAVATAAPGAIPSSTLLALADAARERLDAALRDSGITVPPRGDSLALAERPRPPSVPGFGAARWFRGVTSNDLPRLSLDTPRGGLEPPPILFLQRGTASSLLAALALMGAGSRPRWARLGAIAALAALALVWWVG